MRPIALAVTLALGLALPSPAIADDWKTERSLSVWEIQSKLAVLRLHAISLGFAGMDGQAAFCLVGHGQMGWRRAICAYRDLESCERMIAVFRDACRPPVMCVEPADGQCAAYDAVRREVQDRRMEMQRVENEIQRLEAIYAVSRQSPSGSRR